MSSIETLIGKRLEAILLEKYPGLVYIGDDKNRVPDFEHPGFPEFYAEAKASYNQHDFAAHLKRRQAESFKDYEERKQVLYLIGFHDFSDANRRLGTHGESMRKRILSRYMNLELLYVVDNSIITSIWNMRNGIGGKNEIEDCVLRKGHLNQIITDKTIKVRGQEYRAREYYGVPKSGYVFALPSFVENKGFAIGHILPEGSERIIDFFYHD